MTLIDQWTAIAAIAAAVSLAVRGELLKPTLAAFASAPAWVFVAPILLSIVLAARTISIVAGGHANAWEASAYTTLAAYAAAMLVNLIRQRGRQAQHDVIAGVVTSAMVRPPPLQAAQRHRGRL